MGDLQKPSIGTAHSNVQDKVEVLIERRIASRGCAVFPRVVEQSVVLGHLSELAELVERLLLLVSQEQNLLDSAVDVEVDVVFSPLHAEGVVSIRVFSTADLLSTGRAPVRVGGVGGA